MQYLKQLEFQGFKSFAHKTVLEFPTAVSAIVGPNGSGKSNIADAIRWVLGEQSMKGLRAKKGEDLIFNGTPGLAKMSKASVFLRFDNSGKKFNLDFEEVAIGRQIFRTGESQYFLNDSPVRLKDIFAVLAGAGMGEMKYNIIGQGQADSLLSASSRERREVFEESLGLKELQLKKNDAEKRLEAAKENLVQVKNLISEIAPHLKYLEKQAKKLSERETIRLNLNEKQKIYFSAVFKNFSLKEEKFKNEKNPLLENISGLEEEIKKLAEEIKKEEDVLPNFGQDFEILEKTLAELEEKRQALEREIGRLEGRIEAEKEMAAAGRAPANLIGSPRAEIAVSFEYAVQKLGEIKNSFAGLEFEPPENFKAAAAKISEKIDLLISELQKGEIFSAVKEDGSEQMVSGGNEEVVSEISLAISESEKAKERLKAEVSGISEISAKTREDFRNLSETSRKAQEKLRDFERLFRTKESALQNFKNDFSRIEFEEGRLAGERSEVEKEMAEAGFAFSGLIDGDFGGLNSQDLRRQVERLKIELERVGGIDEETIKEYNETRERHDFLSGQTADLEKSSESLYQLIAQIDVKIENDFRAGFEKINEEFDRYFRMIFNGGSAKLALIEERLEASEEDDFSEEAEELAGGRPAASFPPKAAPPRADKQAGVEIKVDLPRKKIKSTAMLSGGERALTSIALLFAIIAVNPPPFIVLDEIDAALDEANSRRYGKILQDLKEKSQFIVITHNRETMEQAGTLYGVTVHEDGSSKLLSLKLEEAEQKYVR